MNNRSRTYTHTKKTGKDFFLWEKTDIRDFQTSPPHASGFVRFLQTNAMAGQPDFFHGWPHMPLLLDSSQKLSKFLFIFKQFHVPSHKKGWFCYSTDHNSHTHIPRLHISYKRLVLRFSKMARVLPSPSENIFYSFKMCWNCISTFTTNGYNTRSFNEDLLQSEISSMKPEYLNHWYYSLCSWNCFLLTSLLSTP